MMPFCMIMMIVIILNGFFLCMKIYSSECCFSFIRQFSLLCCYELYNNGSVWTFFLFIYFSVVIADKYIISRGKITLKKYESFSLGKKLKFFNSTKIFVHLCRKLKFKFSVEYS